MNSRIIQVANELNKLSGRFTEIAMKRTIIKGEAVILIQPEKLTELAEILSSWANVLLEELENKGE